MGRERKKERKGKALYANKPLLSIKKLNKCPEIVSLKMGIHI